MALTDKDVDHVARLARLALSDEERARYREQLAKILEHINDLNKYDVSGVAPTSHVVPVVNVGREDEPRTFENIEGILSLAPEREEAFFKVPKVIE